MRDKVVREKKGAAEEEEAAGWVQNQKQEPHTKMWGKTRVSTKTFSLKPNFNLDSSASGLRFARSAVHDMSEWGP